MAKPSTGVSPPVCLADQRHACGKGETITTAWIAGRATVVEVKAFSEVGRIVGELPGAEASAVFGPSWEVNSANVAREQARRSAAIDAQLRAAAYADAVHLKLGMRSCA